MLPENVTNEGPSGANRPREERRGGARPGAGAPRGNRNATTHGTRSWLAVGGFPKGCSHVRRYVGRMRVEVEAAVVAVHGEIGVYHAALVQSACRHEGRALLLTRWLRVAADLSLNEKLAVLREIGNATDSRDRCLKALGLDQAAEPRDPWSILTAPGMPTHAQNASDPKSDRGASQPTDASGHAPGGHVPYEVIAEQQAAIEDAKPWLAVGSPVSEGTNDKDSTQAASSLGVPPDTRDAGPARPSTLASGSVPGTASQHETEQR